MVTKSKEALINEEYLIFKKVLKGYHPRRYSRKWLTAAAQLVSGKISAPTAKPKAKPKAKK
jgi:hypothetical protein